LAWTVPGFEANTLGILVPNIHIAPLRYILSPSMRSVLRGYAVAFLLVGEAFLPRRRHQELPGSSRRSSELGGPISALWVRFACARSRRSSSAAELPRFLPRWERTLSLRTSALCCKLQVRSSSAPFHAGALVSTGVGGRLFTPTGTRMAWSSSVRTCDTPVQSADAPVLCASWVPCCANGAKCSLNVVVFGNLQPFPRPLGML